jgi:hypothetical protein
MMTRRYAVPLEFQDTVLLPRAGLSPWPRNTAAWTGLISWGGRWHQEESEFQRAIDESVKRQNALGVDGDGDGDGEHELGASSDGHYRLQLLSPESGTGGSGGFVHTQQDVSPNQPSSIVHTSPPSHASASPSQYPQAAPTAGAEAGVEAAPNEPLGLRDPSSSSSAAASTSAAASASAATFAAPLPTVAWGAKREPQWYALKDGWWWAVVDDKLKWDAATAATAGASLRVLVQYFYDPDDQWEVRRP